MAMQTLPALVLLDIQLPELDGFEVLRRLRADARTRHVPVVAVSASAMPADIRAGLEAGFVDYLTKPLEIGPLHEAVMRAVRPRSPHSPDGRGTVQAG
jgi:CheY-like chemotaxis protein